MMRSFGTLIVLLGLAHLAVAQSPYGTSNPYGNTGASPYGAYGNYGGYGYPGGFGAQGRASAPALSPYLNLFRNNPAINFYNGVRPGLGGSPFGGGSNFMPGFLGYSQNRAGFLPGASNPTQEPTPVPAAGAEIPSLPPSGHPVVFGAPGLAGANRGFPRAGNTAGSSTPPPPQKRSR